MPWVVFHLPSLSLMLMIHLTVDLSRYSSVCKHLLTSWVKKGVKSHLLNSTIAFSFQLLGIFPVLGWSLYIKQALIVRWADNPSASLPSICQSLWRLWATRSIRSYTARREESDTQKELNRKPDWNTHTVLYCIQKGETKEAAFHHYRFKPAMHWLNSIEACFSISDH